MRNLAITVPVVLTLSFLPSVPVLAQVPGGFPVESSENESGENFSPENNVTNDLKNEGSTLTTGNQENGSSSDSSSDGNNVRIEEKKKINHFRSILPSTSERQNGGYNFSYRTACGEEFRSSTIALRRRGFGFNLLGNGLSGGYGTRLTRQQRRVIDQDRAQQSLVKAVDFLSTRNISEEGQKPFLRTMVRLGLNPDDPNYQSILSDVEKIQVSRITKCPKRY